MSAKFESILMKLAVLAGGLMLPGMAHACTYQFNYSYNPVAAAGGYAAVQVVTQPGCAWSVSEGFSWLAITSARSGHGPANVSFYVAPNPTRAARKGWINGFAGLNLGGNSNCIPGRSNNCGSQYPAMRLTLVENGG